MDDDEIEGASTREFILGEVEAVVAGTLALMTAVAQGCCSEHRRAIRGKVIANLAELERHAELSEQFRAVASHLQQHWQALDADHASGTSHWHRPPGLVQ